MIFFFFAMYSILENFIFVPYLSIIAWKIRQITYVLTQNRITHIHHLDGIKHMPTINICLFEDDIVMMIVVRS